MEGNVVFSNTHTPYDTQLYELTHINISSPHSWDSMKVSFKKCYQSLEEEVGGIQYVRNVVSSNPEEEYEDEYFVFDMNNTNGKIA